jgi:hypothetical protein
LPTTGNPAPYVGFDVYPINDATAIPAHERGFVRAPVIPDEIGRAFDSMLALAREADACCREATCTRDDTTNAHCMAFASMTPVTLDPSFFRDFAFLDGEYADSMPAASALEDRYTMPLEFVLRGVNPSGDEVYSRVFEQRVSFCRSCGARVGGARQPMAGMSCFH